MAPCLRSPLPAPHGEWWPFRPPPAHKPAARHFPGHQPGTPAARADIPPSPRLRSRSRRTSAIAHDEHEGIISAFMALGHDPVGYLLRMVLGKHVLPKIASYPVGRKDQ